MLQVSRYMRLLTITLTAIAILLVSAWLVIFTRPIQHALLAATPVAGEPLASRIQATDALLEYFAGHAPLPTDLSSREHAHLADVRGLMLGLQAVTLLTLAVLLGMVAAALRRGQGLRLVAALGVGAKVNLVAIAAFTILGLLAFPFLFDAFHRVAFRNDLWQLPSEATLLRLYPSAYFAANGGVIFGLNLLLAATLWLATRPKKTTRNSRRVAQE